ncbi:MAG: amidohydrolase [Phycisphaerales bacterium]|nr:amidohydrolase [Phycisphaerae bacterium]NNM24643.1 amidohydrolase [Phycisphaerales bacterium]
MSELQVELDRLIDGRQDRLIQLRRRFHATPESSGEERQTSALVAETLREHGYEPRLGPEGIGVTAELDLGAERDTFIAVRSELDCVDVNDDKQVPYASTQPGRCHACGHDAHTTINLATASVLAEARARLASLPFRHNLRFLFQPAEEAATGARSMIKDGALNGVEAIIALHVDPTLETGHVGVRNGALTSACKLFEVTVRGRSGHTARPFEAVDPIPAATNLVSLFYQLAPRSIDSRYPLALTVASIHTGMARNAIPDAATIFGTLRAARVEELEAVQKRMHAVAEGMERATGCDIDLDFHHACPATRNDEIVTRRFAAVAADRLGVDRVQWLEVPSLGGEDFAFYQELVPGSIIRLGAAMPDARARRPLHSSLFDIDEGALTVGAKVLTAASLDLAAEYIGSHA